MQLDPIFVDQDIIDALHEMADPLGGVGHGSHGTTIDEENIPCCALGCLAKKDTGYSGNMYSSSVGVSELVSRAKNQGLTDARNDVVVQEWLREVKGLFWSTRMPIDAFLKRANIHPKPLTSTE